MIGFCPCVRFRGRVRLQWDALRLGAAIDCFPCLRVSSTYLREPLTHAGLSLACTCIAHAACVVFARVCQAITPGVPHTNPSRVPVGPPLTALLPLPSVNGCISFDRLKVQTNNSIPSTHFGFACACGTGFSVVRAAPGVRAEVVDVCVRHGAGRRRRNIDIRATPIVRAGVVDVRVRHRTYRRRRNPCVA